MLWCVERSTHPKALRFTFLGNEAFNCLTCQGYHLKHNFGHGSEGLANLLAFALHTLLDCLRGPRAGPPPTRT